MPELPDITVYIEALEQRIQGATLERVLVASPFLLRTAVPPLSSVEKRKVTEVRRLGKRICIGVEGDLWLVLHLMIAGRLHWYEDRAKALKARAIASFVFGSGTLTLTEAGTQKRASLHVVEGEEGLARLDPGGIEVFNVTEKEFAAALQAKNHTLKRALTDPRILSGIGNAYSDEILHTAQLSPFVLTQKLTPDEIKRLFDAIKSSLTGWIERLREEYRGRFPEKVTAFRPDMATHGKYGEPCPRCGSKIQRIRYGSNETNYCPKCQTGGKLLADRALSRLLKDDWPRTPEELENLTKG
ncbi:MAG TPA: DNA-formamidopyrimidine glycosylase family protein [Pyrinomonadaceae bacterium]|nr:DNA-formamidopyrimidine glycosylase family protein [Pyrinomonadaceae bacterium]